MIRLLRDLMAIVTMALASCYLIEKLVALLIWYGGISGFLKILTDLLVG